MLIDKTDAMNSMLQHAKVKYVLLNVYCHMNIKNIK